MKNIDLKQPSWSYFLGLMQGDGHLSSGSGKGRLQIEISSKDLDLFDILDEITGIRGNRCSRNRVTNFGQLSAVSWAVCDLEFRKVIALMGLPVGRKNQVVRPPSTEYSAPDFWRGWIDADGSLGLASDGLPFISLCTSSEHIASAFVDFLHPIIGEKKNINRNNRDGIFNIVVMREKAQSVIGLLYYAGSFSIARKKKLAKLVLDWKRPVEMRLTGTQKKWTIEEDHIVLTHPANECAKMLERSLKSVHARSWRLRTGKVSHPKSS